MDRPNPVQPSTPRAKRLSRLQVIFIVVLTVPFIAQIVIAIGLTNWLSLQSGRQAVSQMTSRLRNEMGDRVEDELEDFLETPHLVNQLNANAARLGQLDFDNSRALEVRFWQQLQTFASLSNIGFGNANGNYVASDRRGESVRLGHRDENSPGGRLRMYETDANANPTELAYTGPPNYDPRTRPWYEQGRQSQTGQWTDIFTYSAQPVYVISATRALYDETGTFRGVILTDLILSDINQFLRSLDVGETGKVFIMERSGQLVAASDPTIPYRIIDGEANRVEATESSSTLVQASAQFLLEEFGAFTSIQESEQLRFEVEGDRHFLEVIPYVDPRGLDWLIVIAVPEADFLREINEGRRSAIALAIVAVVLSIAVGLILARWLVGPIARLAAAATAVASGDWQGAITLDRDDELGMLATAFNQMTGQLQESLLSLERQKTTLAEAQQIARLGSWEYSFDTKTLQCSDELCQIVGLDQAEITFEQAFEQVHPDDRQRVEQTILRAVSAQERFEMDHRIIRQDGQVRFVQSNGRPAFDESGRVTQILGTLMDITDRKQVEAALQVQAEELAKANQLLMQTKSSLEHRNQELDQFAYVVSHDLKAPLRAIANLATWLEEDADGNLPEESQQHLVLLRSRVTRMESLINGLLTYSRVGRMDTLPEIVNVEDLVTDVIDSLAPPDGMTVHVASELPTLVTYPLPLQQVFSNLISNAIKHGGDRAEATVTIAAQDQGDFYEFSVADNGPGIAPEFHDQIFGIFQTLQSRDKGENTGIGLSVVKKIVETGGGKIWVESIPGDGATFRFTWRKASPAFSTLAAT